MLSCFVLQLAIGYCQETNCPNDLDCWEYDENCVCIDNEDYDCENHDVNGNCMDGAANGNGGNDDSDNGKDSDSGNINIFYYSYW